MLKTPGGISRKSYAKAWTNSDARNAGFKGNKTSNCYCERIQNPSGFLWRKKKTFKLFQVSGFFGKILTKNLDWNILQAALYQGASCVVSSFSISSIWPMKRNFDSGIREIFARGIRNLRGKLCLWDPESWALESRKHFKKSESHNDWNPKSKFHWQCLESKIPGVESRVQDLLGFPYHVAIPRSIS